LTEKIVKKYKKKIGTKLEHFLGVDINCC